MEEDIQKIINKPQPNDLEMYYEIWQTAQEKLLERTIKFLREQKFSEDILSYYESELRRRLEED